MDEDTIRDRTFCCGGGGGLLTDDLMELRSGGARAQLPFILPTIFDARQKMAVEMLRAMVKVYGRRMIADPIPNNVTVKEAPARGGLTVLEYAPESPGGLAYQKFVDKVYSHG
jgi:cellulose biosynthesis protein BcsQ